MITGRDVKLFMAVLVFFVGFQIISVGKGVYDGDINTKADMVKAMNPAESMDTYQQWLAESYQDSTSASPLQQRNAGFGIVFSLLAILVFFAFLASAIYIPLPNEPKFALLAIALAVPIFAWLGGFEGLWPVIKSSVFGADWVMPAFETNIYNAINETVINATEVVDLRT